jgi:hypothetical protein
MDRNNCWLPPLNPYDFEQDYKIYEASLYKKYCKDFIDTNPTFESKIVKVRFHPKVDGYEESFIHFTCKNYENVKNREPDFKRCERLHWIRKVIENYLCKEKCSVSDCDGIKVWEEPYKNYITVHFLFEEERYFVIIERREYYNLLITAYYLEYDNALEKQLKHYNQFKKAEDASATETSPETPSTTSR